MPRYIDADALRDALYDADAITMKGVRILNQFPTISPDEVRGVGEWIDDSVASNVFRCSICENDAPVSPTDGTEYKSNYCPSCGARMKGAETSE